ncbi:MAG: histidine phosphatase family protein [Clostridia bacterium]|nr:histidine phosphatase family protein [Clostridia bacterium]
MKILIIRHGDPDYSIDSLTEKGWREAELLSERLAKISIDDVYTSPLGRARDTASCTLKKIGKEAEVLDWLQEFRGQITSPFTGGTRVCWDLPPSLWCSDIRYYDWKDWRTSALMSAGNAGEIYDETVSGIDALLNRYGWARDGMAYRGGEDKTIALFCHFGMGITVLSYLLGISPVIAQNGFFLAPTSVTTLVTETDKSGCSHFRAIGVGDISHLHVAGEPMSESGLYPNFEK